MCNSVTKRSRWNSRFQCASVVFIVCASSTWDTFVLDMKLFIYQEHNPTDCYKTTWQEYYFEPTRGHFKCEFVRKLARFCINQVIREFILSLYILSARVLECVVMKQHCRVESVINFILPVVLLNLSLSTWTITW